MLRTDFSTDDAPVTMTTAVKPFAGAAFPVLVGATSSHDSAAARSATSVSGGRRTRDRGKVTPSVNRPSPSVDRTSACRHDKSGPSQVARNDYVRGRGV